MLKKLTMWASWPEPKRLHSVGPDEVDEDKIPSHVDFAVYYYEVGDWGGDGNCVFHDSNTGKWGYRSLGHCSCYGPIEVIDNWDGDMTWQKLLSLVKDDSTELGRSPGDYEYDHWKAIENKLECLRAFGQIPGLRKKKGRKK
jgi:hypothetical protein